MTSTFHFDHITLMI